MAFILAPEIDQPTANLLIQLQLQDAGLYFISSKGKSRDPTDEELAFQLQNEELEVISQLLADRQMATSFTAAVQADGCIITMNQVKRTRVKTKISLVSRRRIDVLSLQPISNQHQQL